jgi:hypothetical protein
MYVILIQGTLKAIPVAKPAAASESFLHPLSTGIPVFTNVLTSVTKVKYARPDVSKLVQYKPDTPKPVPVEETQNYFASFAPANFKFYNQSMNNNANFNNGSNYNNANYSNTNYNYNAPNYIGNYQGYSHYDVFQNFLSQLPPSNTFNGPIFNVDQIIALVNSVHLPRSDKRKIEDHGPTAKRRA